MLFDGEYSDRPLGSYAVMATPSPSPALPVAQPPLIPPPPWSENYVPELDPDYDPGPEPEAEAVEAEPPARPKFPPPPWAKAEAVEEEPGRYPPPQRGEP
jgi:hypothetical protein